MHERRENARNRTFLKAVIVTESRGRVDCVVKDLSDTGARILVADAPSLPQHFRLHLPKLDRWVEAEIRWRRSDSIGVQFEAEPSEATVDARMRQLEVENKRLRRMLEEIRNDPGKIQEILERAA